ncbi:MAG: hypothetical protein K5985_04135 [Lachnospiraceae bacterium]|nr:hypothetical protein [Lachnospiraceae bacterium]
MKRRVRILAYSFIFLALILLTQRGLKYILMDDVDSYTRVMLHELYHSPENIDVLFTGSSHCYRGVDPRVVDEELGVNSFNAGSSSQSIDGSLAMIREAAKHHNLKRIFLEVEFNTCLEIPFHDRSQLTSTYILTEYMPFSPDKLKYMLRASSIEKYPNTFLPLGKYKGMTEEIRRIPDILERKQSEEYRNYGYVNNSIERYYGKGYVGSEIRMDGTGFVSGEPYCELNLHNFSKDWRRTIHVIGDFCRDRGIELAFFCAPTTDFQLVGVENYDEFRRRFRELTSDIGAEWYDFNLCRSEYLPLSDADFMDDNHINQYGAEKFSRLLGRFLAGGIKEEELFYDSYAEKREKEGEGIFGIIAQEDREAHAFSLSAVSDAPDNRLSYEVFTLPEGEEKPVRCRDRGPEQTVSYPEGESGTLIIDVYLEGKEEPYRGCTLYGGASQESLRLLDEDVEED